MRYQHEGFARAADGTRIFHGESGSGPPLLLLDGIGCDGWAWNHIQPHLAERCRVVHLHYRGHGRSGAPVDPNAISIETLADDGLRVMDAAAVERAALVAHSMGTQVALEVLRSAPERVEALVLICGSYGRITHTFHGNDWLHRTLPALIEQVRKHEALARALWGRLPPQLAYRIAGWIGEIDGGSVRADDFRQYVEHLSDISLDLYLRLLKEAGEHSAEELLASIRQPTLVIAAERDTFTPRDVVRELAERIPAADYMELAGASHAAPAERAGEINARIDRFLAALGYG
ncbi:MAG: alpha/beta hydrolase [Myxococcales bacterium]|nr:alpha/beta hydrolase [Myxococcales bacterium]